mgnify:FL=1
MVGDQTISEHPKEESDVDVYLLEETFKNTRLSELLFDKSRSTKEVFHRFSSEDIKALLEEINLLKDIVAWRNIKA